MSMTARKEYLLVLREKYLQAKTKKEKRRFWMNIARIPANLAST